MEEPAHLSSALIPGGREGQAGAGPGPSPSATPTIAASWAGSQLYEPHPPSRVLDSVPTQTERRKPWRAGYGIPLAQDRLAESRGEKEDKGVQKESCLGGREPSS